MPDSLRRQRQLLRLLVDHVSFCAGIAPHHAFCRQFFLLGLVADKDGNIGQQSVPHVSVPCAGIAPYRAFWRRFFLEDVPNYKFGGLAWLFMGVANSDAKLYDDELQMLVKEYPKQVYSSPSKGCGASVTLSSVTSPSLPYDELQKSCEKGFQAGLPPDMFLCIWIFHSCLMSGWHCA